MPTRYDQGSHPQRECIFYAPERLVGRRRRPLSRRRHPLQPQRDAAHSFQSLFHVLTGLYA